MKTLPPGMYDAALVACEEGESEMPDKSKAPYLRWWVGLQYGAKHYAISLITSDRIVRQPKKRPALADVISATGRAPESVTDTAQVLPSRVLVSVRDGEKFVEIASILMPNAQTAVMNPAGGVTSPSQTRLAPNANGGDPATQIGVFANAPPQGAPASVGSSSPTPTPPAPTPTPPLQSGVYTCPHCANAGLVTRFSNADEFSAHVPTCAHRRKA